MLPTQPLSSFSRALVEPFLDLAEMDHLLQCNSKAAAGVATICASLIVEAKLGIPVSFHKAEMSTLCLLIASLLRVLEQGCL
jgi:hypothetical protein